MRNAPACWPEPPSSTSEHTDRPARDRPALGAGPRLPSPQRLSLLGSVPAACSRSWGSSSTTPGAIAVHPATAGVAARRPTVGRAVAGHAPQRSDHARGRAVGGHHGPAPVPPQGVGCRRAAVVAGPPRPASRPWPGSPPGATPMINPSPSCSMALTPSRPSAASDRSRPRSTLLARHRRRRAGHAWWTVTDPAWRCPTCISGESRSTRSSQPAGRRPTRRPRWCRPLAARYPGDASVAVTLLLNHVTLAPGEAIVLGPGNLHAYLHGAGIELMGASDNVVRGGLTTKPVDIDDLLAVVDPTPCRSRSPRCDRVPARRHRDQRCCASPAPPQPVATSHELVVTSRGRHRLPRPRCRTSRSRR